MKKLTLATLIIFILALGGIYIKAYSSSTKVQAKTVINPPNIDLSNISPTQEKAQTNSSFTQTEVAKHIAKNDCYLLINNNVYDVSSYMGSHPGGSRTISARCGKEVTGIFASVHSNRAWDLLKKYKIGSIDSTAQNITPQIIDKIFTSLQEVNPNAEIVNVKPKNNFYIAKIIYQGKLYEIHLNDSGQIIQEEVESDENDWSAWNKDSDDNK